VIDVEEDILKNEQVSNELFARFLCENGLVKSDDVLLEYVPRINDAVSIDDIFKDNTKLIYCNGLRNSEEIHKLIIDSIGVYNYKVNLLSNAYNENIETAARKILPYGVFNIGICTDNLEEFKCGKLKLVKFASELRSTGIKTDTYEREYGYRKLYLVSSRRRINGR
jgi:hypothetical protein